MTEKIAFYHNPQSRAVIVHWMLEEVDADYRIHHLDLQKGEHKSPAFLAINPMGKVPAIVVGDTVITENSGNHCLAGGYSSRRGVGSDAELEATRDLLPLAVFRRQLHRAGDD